jgi:hypothetical protein
MSTGPLQRIAEKGQHDILSTEGNGTQEDGKVGYCVPANLEVLLVNQSCVTSETGTQSIIRGTDHFC